MLGQHSLLHYWKSLRMGEAIPGTLVNVHLSIVTIIRWLLYALDRWPDYSGTAMFNLYTQ